MAVLLDAKHTVLIKGSIAPRQLTSRIPHPSLRDSLAVSSPHHFAVLSLLARQSSEKQPLPKTTSAYAQLCNTPCQSEFPW